MGSLFAVCTPLLSALLPLSADYQPNAPGILSASRSMDMSDRAVKNVQHGGMEVHASADAPEESMTRDFSLKLLELSCRIWWIFAGAHSS